MNNGFEPNRNNQNETYSQNSTYQSDTYSYSSFETKAPALDLNRYVMQTFLWMAAGLALTFVVALICYQNNLLYYLYRGAGSTAVFYVPAVLQIAVVLIMSFARSKLSVGAARFCFFLYAALTGVTFSSYFWIYDLDVLVYAFGLTALFFGGMAIVTYKMRLDVSFAGPILLFGLIFLLIVGAFGMITGFTGAQIFTCWIGIAIFIGYTAYDTQMIVRQYEYYRGNDTLLKKASIFAALQLYLDFINLLLRIIAILGNSKSKK